MNLRATPESKFLLKYLVIGLGCLGFAIYSFYDGIFAYPARIPRAQAWEELSAEETDEQALVKRWREISKEKGWSSKRPTSEESVEAIENLIIYQYIFMAIGLGIGLPCLIWYLRSRNTWIESTEDSVRSSDGTEVKLTQIQKFDKKKWEKKGIGVLHYNAADGSSKKFVIDDLKYNRKTTDEIVCWIESKIPAEMIVNGPPETVSKPEQENIQKEDPSVEADQDEVLG